MNDITNDLTGMLFGNENLMKEFNKDRYADAFHDYCNKYASVFDRIESEYINCEDKDGFIKDIATGFADHAKAKESELKKRSDRDHFLVDHNSVLTVYMLPSLIERGSEACTALAGELVEKWNRAFTRYTISLGTFSEIDAGFKRKLCYITTAVCESLGKSDDCYELRVLREYRDGYLMNSDDGADIVRKYYNIAPTIVNRINRRSDSETVYGSIFKRYIEPCISLIENGRKKECRDLYSDMVCSLEKEYMRYSNEQ